MHKLMSGILLPAVCLLSFASSSLACDGGHARYVLRSDPAVHAQYVFRGAPGPQHRLLKVTNLQTAVAYWFLMDAGNGVGYIHLYPVAELKTDDSPVEFLTGHDGRRLAGTPFFQFNSQEEVIGDLPDKSKPAPDSFFLSEMDQLLWYYGDLLAPSFPAARDHTGFHNGLFTRVSCADGG